VLGVSWAVHVAASEEWIGKIAELQSALERVRDFAEDVGKRGAGFPVIDAGEVAERDAALETGVIHRREDLESGLSSDLFSRVSSVRASLPPDATGRVNEDWSG